MAVDITLAVLRNAIRVNETDEANNELTRLLLTASSFIEQYAPDAPTWMQNEAAVRLVGYLYDQPSVSRAGAYANSIRNSGAAVLLAPWREMRAGSIGSADGSPGGAGPEVEALEEQFTALQAQFTALSVAVQTASEQIQRAVDATTANDADIAALQARLGSDEGETALDFSRLEDELSILTRLTADLVDNADAVRWTSNIGGIALKDTTGTFPATGFGSRNITKPQGGWADAGSVVMRINNTFTALQKMAQRYRLRLITSGAADRFIYAQWIDVTDKVTSNALSQIFYSAGSINIPNDVDSIQLQYWESGTRTSYVGNSPLAPDVAALKKQTADLHAAEPAGDFDEVDSDGTQGGVSNTNPDREPYTLAEAKALTYRARSSARNEDFDDLDQAYAVVRIPAGTNPQAYRGIDIVTTDQIPALIVSVSGGMSRLGSDAQWQYYAWEIGPGPYRGAIELQIADNPDHIGTSWFTGRVLGNKTVPLAALADAVLARIAPALTGNGGKFLAVKSDATAVELVDKPGGGSGGGGASPELIYTWAVPANMVTASKTSYELDGSAGAVRTAGQKLKTFLETDKMKRLIITVQQPGRRYMGSIVADTAIDGSVPIAQWAAGNNTIFFGNSAVQSLVYYPDADGNGNPGGQLNLPGLGTQLYGTFPVTVSLYGLTYG